MQIINVQNGPKLDIKKTNRSLPVHDDYISSLSIRQTTRGFFFLRLIFVHIPPTPIIIIMISTITQSRLSLKDYSNKAYW